MTRSSIPQEHQVFGSTYNGTLLQRGCKSNSKSSLSKKQNSEAMGLWVFMVVGIAIFWLGCVPWPRLLCGISEFKHDDGTKHETKH
uniref:Uncharacterized protein n=1 Tax=Pyxicephalus adspersus TaxID=30357 RepID=A0AAV3AEY0_PYXAD|nr:TPA: hypothetical protein GDO54_018364 [Pyxicephalus adspersus]